MQDPHPPTDASGVTEGPTPHSSARVRPVDVVDVVGDHDADFDTLARLAADVLGAPSVAITLVGHRELVDIGAHPHFDDGRRRPIDTDPSLAAFLVSSLQDDVHHEIAPDSPGGAERTGIGIRADDELVGVLWASGADRVHIADRERHLRDLRQLAEALLARELGRRRDRLTRLLPREVVADVIRQEWRSAQRAEQPMSLLLASIDDYDAYLERYGTVAGDQCVAEVAHAIGRALHGTGATVARNGPNGFAVVVPDADRARADVSAAAIVRNVEAVDLPSAGREGPVTISVGAATAEPGEAGSAPTLLISAAEQALHLAEVEGGGARVHAAATGTIR